MMCRLRHTRILFLTHMIVQGEGVGFRLAGNLHMVILGDPGHPFVIHMVMAGCPWLGLCGWKRRGTHACLEAPA